MFIGMIFVYLIPKMPTKHYLLRGAAYGAIVWFLIHAVVLAFQIPAIITRSDLITCMVNSVDSVIYGMILAYVINYLEKREKV